MTVAETPKSVADLERRRANLIEQQEIAADQFAQRDNELARAAADGASFDARAEIRRQRDAAGIEHDELARALALVDVDLDAARQIEKAETEVRLAAEQENAERRARAIHRRILVWFADMLDEYRELHSQQGAVVAAAMRANFGRRQLVGLTSPAAAAIREIGRVNGFRSDAPVHELQGWAGLFEQLRLASFQVDALRSIIADDEDALEDVTDDAAEEGPSE